MPIDMYDKITSASDISLLAPGSILIKYPAMGAPEEEIDLSDEDKFMAYEVHKVGEKEVELMIPTDEIASATQPVSVPHMNGRSGPSVLVKNMSALIVESVWWIVRQ